jgi:hypothetical protein
MTKVFIGIMGLLCISLLLSLNHPSRENNMVQLAIQTVRIQADLSEEVEVKLVEKRESAIPDFYMVKLLVVKKDKEVPIVVYVDRSAEKVIVGTLFIHGENATLREAGGPGISKSDSGKLEPGKTSLSY